MTYFCFKAAWPDLAKFKTPLLNWVYPKPVKILKQHWLTFYAVGQVIIAVNRA